MDSRMKRRTRIIIFCVGLITLGMIVGCTYDIWLAHVYNELGISDYNKRHLDHARINFEKSIALNVSTEIPTYNLANNYMVQTDYVRAHDLYQQTIEYDPDLYEAFYNDGYALFKWGAGYVIQPEDLPEDDPEIDYCQYARMIKKAIRLMKSSMERFEKVAGMTESGDLSRAARENADRNRN